MKELVEDIYQRLLLKFGNRNWWPGETRDEVIIGAILTQNVSWRNVAKSIEILKSQNMLSLKAIHDAEESEIASLIKPTRFYNQKAKSIKNFTDYLFDNYSGKLDFMFSKNIENLRKELLDIKGLGSETADCILLYGGNKLTFVIDAYTKRIFSRIGIGNNKWSYFDYQQLFMANLEPDVELYQDYHAQIVHLGHSFCKSGMPECSECPLFDLCKNAKI